MHTYSCSCSSSKCVTMNQNRTTKIVYVIGNTTLQIRSICLAFPKCGRWFTLSDCK